MSMGQIKITNYFNTQSDVVLYQGDCLQLLHDIPDNSIKLIVTSPPYNLGKEYEKRIHLEEYLGFQKKIILECVRVLSEDGSICWQVGNYVENGEVMPLDILLYPIFASVGLKMRNRVIWHFGHGLHCSKRFSGRYETLMWFTKSDNYVFNLDPVRVPQKYPNKKYFKGPKAGKLSCNPLGKNPGDVWMIPNVKSNHPEKTDHPCQFPVELIERLILSMTNEEDWVMDPFMGVATTAVAAVLHKRKAAGAELLKKYIDKGRERVKLAAEGKLDIRPMNRPIYDPNNPQRIKDTEKIYPQQQALFKLLTLTGR